MGDNREPALALRAFSLMYSPNSLNSLFHAAYGITTRTTRTLYDNESSRQNFAWFSKVPHTESHLCRMIAVELD